MTFKRLPSLTKTVLEQLKPLKLHRKDSQTQVSHFKHVSSYLIKDELLSSVLEASGLKNAYDNEDMTILEMSPGSGANSIALYNYFQPKRHVLLEPRKAFFSHISSLTKNTDGRMVLHERDGYSWATYSELYQKHPEYFYQQTSKEVRLGPNRRFLFTGHLPAGTPGILLGTQFVMHLIQRDWLGILGRVRLLLWMSPELAYILLACNGYKSRSSLSVLRELMCQIRVLAAPVEFMDTLKKGYLHSSAVTYPVMKTISTTDEAFAPSANPLVLIDISCTSYQSDVPLDILEYVIQSLLVQKSQPLKETVSRLCPGAENLVPLLKKRGVDIQESSVTASAKSLENIARIYHKWPFRPKVMTSTLLEKP
ncbi:RNA polymerase specificity factor [Schizosaccharomyces japonicus yFS275]|uniref:rRNA adenine N(6)-methyltransferase n=1 Tax=Schizosaccharomyces japonicus (strain yFS275 / FY16936) TaxID=402676 RepID=B6K3U8_SCHJY|nr:RNA polymerase specificity factor [Schizosaccharomyces japonicus yFS275]EEB08155.1 RNA polymerase specificity factor [Schizosaccharomyces japonicus yFS275]